MQLYEDHPSTIIISSDLETNPYSMVILYYISIKKKFISILPYLFKVI